MPPDENRAQPIASQSPFPELGDLLWVLPWSSDSVFGPVCPAGAAPLIPLSVPNKCPGSGWSPLTALYASLSWICRDYISCFEALLFLFPLSFYIFSTISLCLEKKWQSEA